MTSSSLQSISWSEDGECIVIDPDLYPDEASGFFKSTFQSLCNQLRNYGFKRHDKSTKTKVMYYHPKFTRNRPQEWAEIRRKSSRPKVISSVLHIPVVLPPFISKLYNMTSQSKKVIRWSEDGLCIVILNPGLLCEEIYPQYFGKNISIGCFYAKLRRYDFKKI